LFSFVPYFYEVGIAMGYEPDGRRFDSWQGKEMLSVQTGSTVHPDPYAIRTGCSFPGRVADHLYLVPRSRMVELYLHSLVHLNGAVVN
jgi:hypothetical protein